MKLRLTPIIFFCLFGFHLQAQKQGNIWYFGYNNGINFNTDPPTPLTDGQLWTDEGCASIADENGNLLFYTDGVTVYNKNHQVMVNGVGLLGNYSSTQSAIIVPWPGKADLYYIITSDDVWMQGAKGYNYNIVDMEKNGGLGEVTVKNQLLYTPSTEKLTVAPHCNGRDWWVITKEWDSNQFQSYLIDGNGLNTTPVISAAGEVLSGHIDQMIGGIRVSPSGRKLAMAIQGNNLQAASRTELFDFNNATGVVSNGITISGIGSYGVEFSPNSRFLYISYPGFLSSYIDQFDVSTYTDAASLEATRVRISPVFADFGSAWGMQLGPDGKIYVCRGGYVDAIEFPNEKGTTCNYKQNAIPTFSVFMFPNIIPTLLVPIFTINLQQSAIGDPCKRIVQFEAISNQTDNIQYEWNFGDGQTSIEAQPQHVYDFSKESFTVTLKITADVTAGSCKTTQTKTVTTTVSFDAKPVAHFTTSNSCGDRVAVLTNASTISSGTISGWYWEFPDGSTSADEHPTHNFPSFGEQLVKLVAKSPSGCPSDTLKQTILIKANPTVQIEAPDGCEGDVISFTDQSTIEGSTLTSRLWTFPDGSTATAPVVSQAFSQPGLQTVALELQGANGCSAKTTKQIRVNTLPVAAFDLPASACVDVPVSFVNRSVSSGGAIMAYQWSFSNGSTSAASQPNLTFTQPGTYTATLRVQDNKGCLSTVIQKNISIYKTVAFAGNDTSVVAGTPFQLHGSGGTSYLWAPAQYLSNATLAHPTAVIDADKVFTLTVTENGCTAVDEVEVTVLTDCIKPLVAFTPNGDGINDIWIIATAGCLKQAQVKVFNRYGGEVFESKDYKNNWDGTYKGKPLPDGTYYYVLTCTLNNGKTLYLRGNVTILR